MNRLQRLLYKVGAGFALFHRYKPEADIDSIFGTILFGPEINPFDISDEDLSHLATLGWEYDTRGKEWFLNLMEI